MFIIEPIKKEDARGELKLLYRMIERSLGFIPPHFELFASIDTKSMKEFLELNHFMMNHQKIDKDLLPFLRLYIAKKECRSYCIGFNTKILQGMNIEQNFITNIENKLSHVEFETAQKTLLFKVLKAIYEADKFGADDLQELDKLGFSNKDFFDLLSYAINFMAKSKMIEVYLK